MELGSKSRSFVQGKSGGILYNSARNICYFSYVLFPLFFRISYVLFLLCINHDIETNLMQKRESIFRHVLYGLILVMVSVPTITTHWFLYIYQKNASILSIKIISYIFVHLHIFLTLITTLQVTLLQVSYRVNIYIDFVIHLPSS